MDNLKQGMASIYLAMALKDHHIVVKGSKDRFRDFVYIEDVVDSVIAVLNRRDGNLYECYNISTCHKQSVEGIIEIIQKSLPYHVTCEYIKGTPGDQHGIYGDYSKIREQLNWVPKYDFETGMKLMVDWACMIG